jgi:hypothetical protein
VDRGGTLIEVELLEDGQEADVEAASEWRPLAARVPGRVWAVVAGLAAVGVAGWTVAGVFEERAIDARLAKVDGVSVPLADPLAPVWRVPGGEVLAAVGDTVLVRDADRDEVRAVAVVDGNVRYSRTGSCELVPGDAAGTGAADVRVREAGDDELLLCVEAAGAEAERMARPATARVHDPSTGALLRSIELGPVATSRPVGTDVVSIGVAADGHVVAGRWSLLTGDPVWSYRGPSPVPRTDNWDSSMDETSIRFRLGGWSLALDTATGERVGRARFGAVRSVEARWGPTPLLDGGTATSRFTAGGTETTVLEPDGRERFTVPGFMLTPVVDDGTVSGTLLVVRPDVSRRSQTLAALDAVDGTTRWVSTAPVGQIALVQETVVVRDRDGLTALGAVDGAVRWAARAADGAGTGRGMVTDGRRVLTLDTVGAGAGITARDLRTGAPVWSSRAPVDDGYLTLLPDGTVLALGSGDLVAMRP